MSFVSKNNDSYVFKKDRIKKDKKLGLTIHDDEEGFEDFAREFD
jgi:hypothetical protein